MSPSEPPSPPPPSLPQRWGAALFRRPAPQVRLAAIGVLVGALVLGYCGERFGLDHALCQAWPARAIGFRYGAAYLVAIGALWWAWRRAPDWRLAVGAHAIATAASPFLSSDPLMYAAVGRALAGGASVTTPLSTALGVDHPFLVPLPAAWRQGTSAYGPAWNALAKLIGGMAYDNLAFAIQLHQIAAALALLVGAWIVSRTFARSDFALVALCPLAIIEASLGAHNDALLVPLVALALWAWLRERPALALAALAAGLAIKASAAVLLLPAALAMVLAQIPSARTRRQVLAALLLGAIAALGALPLLRDGPLDAVSRLVERPEVAFDHCTRSVECLPRVLFRFVLHMPTAAWATGLVFRALGISWLGWIALRAAESAATSRAEPAAWLARGLFVYFLVFHGWAQSWYLLPLLPTLPLLTADRRWGPGLRLYTITAVAYYALVLPMSCLTDPLSIAVSDLLEAAITILPPLVLLLRSRREPG